MSSKSYKVGDLSKLLSKKTKSVTEGKKKKNKKLEALFSGEQTPNRKYSDVTEIDSRKSVAVCSSTEKLKMKSSDVAEGKMEIKMEGQDSEERKRKKKKKKTLPVDESEESSSSTISPKKIKRESGRGNPPGYSPPPGIVHEAIAKQKKPKKRKLSVEDAGSEEDPDTETRPRKRKRRDKSKDTRTVFVGNLPLSIKKKKLYKVFAKYGEIENIRYRCLPTSDPKVPKRVIAIKQDFHPERHNCVAYVCFKDTLSAKKALKCNGKEIDKLHIRVDLATQDKAKDIKRSVFVGNLPFDVEEEVIRSHFQDCGTVDNVRIIRDRKTSLGKGFCYVQFQTTDEASLALRLHETTLCKRQIRVMRCQQNPVKSTVTKQVDKSDRKLEKKGLSRKRYEEGGPPNDKKLEKKGHSGRRHEEHGSPSKSSTVGRFFDKRTERSRPRTLPSNIRGSAFKGTQPHRKDKKLKRLSKGKTLSGQKKTFTKDFGSGSAKSNNFKKNKSKHIKFND